jgi:hypothetical protein
VVWCSNNGTGVIRMLRCKIRKECIPFVTQLIRFMNKAPSNKPNAQTDDRRYLSFFAFGSLELEVTRTVSWLQLVVDRRGRELDIFCVVYLCY